MAVLTEGISVVIRRDAIEAKFNGGWHAVLEHAPKRTLCTDGQLASVGFMRPDDVQRFIQFLELSGLVFLEDGTAKDISVVDMLTGPTVNTPWLEFLGKTKDGTVSSCWLFEDPRDKGFGTYLPSLCMEVAVPYGWTYEESLTALHTYVPKLPDDYAVGHAAAERGDYTEAMIWFRKAADQGSVDAQFALGCMHCNGEGASQNFSEGTKWLIRAADQGHDAAQEYLGRIYAKGLGTPQDYVEAIRWRRKAADQGSASAQLSLGLMYFSGRGVQQDYVEARKWFRTAADQDDPDAQCLIGYLYENGQGVAQDFVECAKWYRKAAEQGLAAGQYNLGEMYEKGNGVSLNLVEAYKWYCLAASHESEAQIAKDAVKSRDLVAAKLTDAQIAQVEHRTHQQDIGPDRGI